MDYSKYHQDISTHTIDELTALQKYILEQPVQRLNMEYWGEVLDPEELQKRVSIGKSDDDYDDYVDDVLSEDDVASVIVNQKPPCNTIACMAGSYLMMKGLVKPVELVAKEKEDGLSYLTYSFPGNSKELAEENLGIGTNEGTALFFLPSWERTYGWPQEFEERLHQTKAGTPEYRQVIVDRIEHYKLNKE